MTDFIEDIANVRARVEVVERVLSNNYGSSVFAAISGQVFTGVCSGPKFQGASATNVSLSNSDNGLTAGPSDSYHVAIGTSIIQGKNGPSLTSNLHLNYFGSSVIIGNSKVDGGWRIGESLLSTAYMSIATTGMGSSEYNLLTDGTNTFISGGTGGTTYVRAGANNSTGQVAVSSGAVTITGLTNITGNTFVHGIIHINSGAQNWAYHLQVGPTAGSNVTVNANQVWASVNGVPSTLYLNYSGNGPVIVGGTLTINGGISTPSASISILSVSSIATFSAGIDLTGQLVVNGTSSAPYFDDYGGGWYMSDTTWIRATNSKGVYTGGYVRGDLGVQAHRDVEATLAEGSPSGLFGLPSGYNIAVGRSTIQARLNGSASSLNLNYYGGDVRSGNLGVGVAPSGYGLYVGNAGVRISRNQGLTNKAWNSSQLLVTSYDATVNDNVNSIVGMAFWNQRFGIAPIIRNYGPEGEKMGFSNNPNTAYVAIKAAALETTSSIRYKDNIRAVEDDDAIALAEGFLLTKFRQRVRPQTIVETPLMKRVHSLREKRGQEAVPTPAKYTQSEDHDCSKHPCPGSKSSPCQIAANDTDMFGGMAEWTGAIAPEMAWFDEEGIANSHDVAQIATASLGGTGALSRRLTRMFEKLIEENPSLNWSDDDGPRPQWTTPDNKQRKKARK